VTPTAKRFIFAGGVNAALFLSAFVVAPKACEGGLEVYFWAGVAGLVALLALPFVVRTGSSLLASLAWSLAFGRCGVGRRPIRRERAHNMSALLGLFP
jgi:hypothetical protein